MKVFKYYGKWIKIVVCESYMWSVNLNNYIRDNMVNVILVVEIVVFW